MMLSVLSESRSFGGLHRRYRHRSAVLDCEMVFAVYLPPGAVAGTGTAVPALYWLSGLTCTDENFMQKAGAQRVASELGLALVCPDTSPRGEQVPGDPDGGTDFGLGAGFYLDATEAPWSRHYRMHEYVVAELPALLEAHLPVADRRGISGHSMGGHGALVCALRQPERYLSVSAFAPICHPMESPWGKKAFARYLGADRTTWAGWDACALLAQTKTKSIAHPKAWSPVLVDQGLADGFLASQLMPDHLERAAAEAAFPLTLRRHPGYDHSYYFIATFIEEHLRHHARALQP